MTRCGGVLAPCPAFPGKRENLPQPDGSRQVEPLWAGIGEQKWRIFSEPRQGLK